jgi:hypothetical protein
MLGSRGIYTGIARSQEAENEEEQASYGKAVNDGGVDGILLDLGKRQDEIAKCIKPGLLLLEMDLRLSPGTCQLSFHHFVVLSCPFRNPNLNERGEERATKTIEVQLK